MMDLINNNFEILDEKEMDKVKGGFMPKEKDILDPEFPGETGTK